MTYITASRSRSCDADVQDQLDLIRWESDGGSPPPFVANAVCCTQSDEAGPAAAAEDARIPDLVETVYRKERDMRYTLKQIGRRPSPLNRLSPNLIDGQYENNGGGALRRLNGITQQLASARLR